MSARPSDVTLLLVCGLPGAGKTTLAKQLVATSSTSSRLYERISFDDLYEQQFFENGDNAFEPKVWKASQQEMVLRVIQHLEEYTSVSSSKSTLQRVLLVDDNFLYPSQRKRFFHLATEKNCGFGLIYVNTTVTRCRERNARRNEAGGRIPDVVFERLVTVFEPPNGHQHSWEVNTCEIQDGSNIEYVMDTLIRLASYELGERCSRHMNIQEKAALQCRDRLSTQQNVLHLVDLQLRQWISTQLQDKKELPSGMSTSQYALQLNKSKKSYLAAIKHSYDDIVDRLKEESVENVVVSLVHRFLHQEYYRQLE